MPLSYDFIEKPRQVQAIDEFFSGSADELRRAYDYALEVLERWETLDAATHAVAHEGPDSLQALTDDDIGHFRDHWLDPEKGLHSWSGPAVEDVMRRAYHDAVSAASSKDEPVPIETFWVFSTVEQFEMRVSESKTQITVFALIPKTPEIEFNEASHDQIRSFRPDGPATKG